MGNVATYPHGISDLVLIDGVYQIRPQPHEDMHHPDYFEAKKDYDKFYGCDFGIKFSSPGFTFIPNELA